MNAAPNGFVVRVCNPDVNPFKYRIVAKGLSLEEAEQKSEQYIAKGYDAGLRPASPSIPLL